MQDGMAGTSSGRQTEPEMLRSYHHTPACSLCSGMIAQPSVQSDDCKSRAGEIEQPAVGAQGTSRCDGRSVDSAERGVEAAATEGPGHGTGGADQARGTYDALAPRLGSRHGALHGGQRPPFC